MDNYASLLEKYNALLLENDRLRKENADLRSQLNINDAVCAADNSVTGNQGTVTNKSTPDAKMDLFMSLFVGRDDVFAKRWHSVIRVKAAISLFAKTSGKSVCSTRRNTNARYAPIENSNRSAKKIYTLI